MNNLMNYKINNINDLITAIQKYVNVSDDEIFNKCNIMNNGNIYYVNIENFNNKLASGEISINEIIKVLQALNINYRNTISIMNQDTKKAIEIDIDKVNNEYNLNLTIDKEFIVDRKIPLNCE